MVNRITVAIVFLPLAYIALLFRLYQLQIEGGEIYRGQAQSQIGALTSKRGVIYFTDKNGGVLPVATSKDFSFIYAAPKLIEDAEETANRIAPLIGVPVPEVLPRLQNKESQYELLVKKAGASTTEAVRAERIQGVFIDEAPLRFYPFGTLAAHVLGYVGPSQEDLKESGRYGAEKQFEKRLTGKDGELKEGGVIPPTHGEHIAFTVDFNIQIEAERILDGLVKNFGAKGGSVIVEEPKTGKVLAMASAPGFDGNSYAKSDIGNFLNPAIQKRYEPGSIIKAITIAAGIDAGKITPETTYRDTGSLVISGKKIQNWDLKAHGTVTMTNVLEKSINTGAVFAERALGDAPFRRYLEQFGFSEKTGIDLPGEVKGDLTQLYPNAPPVNFATASYGQGISMTPIELVNAVSAIANGGVLMRPYLNASSSPEVIRRVLTKETAKTVAGMMVSAVDKAEVAVIKGYALAGKTGTAQTPDFKNGGYTHEVVNTFAGFGPTSDPRFVILIKLDEPREAPVAALTVVPAFRDLAQFILNYYNIPPDRN